MPPACRRRPSELDGNVVLLRWNVFRTFDVVRSEGVAHGHGVTVALPLI